jgi:hypothetical protein
VSRRDTCDEGVGDRRCERNVDLQGGPVHAALGALIIAGGRACSTSTRLTHPVITNQTSPHFAETLGF